MSAQAELDFTATGFELAKRGANSAADHAGEEWKEKAYQMFVNFARGNKGFLTEDVGIYARAHGLPDPPSKQAWGAVVLKAKRAGLITAIGYAPRKDPAHHAQPGTVWKWN